MLRDPALWLLTLVGAAIGALYGLRFGPSIGETSLVGAVALGVMGAGPGFVVGAVLTLLRGGRRRRAAARESFVAHLNANHTDPRQRFYVSATDTRALVCEIEDERFRSLDRDSQAALVEKVAGRIRSLLERDGTDMAAELRRNDFGCWVVRMNGTTVYQHPIA